MGHYYSRDGQPRYFVQAKAGHDRPSTVADAKKFGWVPSVTEVIGVLDKPALTRWLFNNGAKASETHPRRPGEPDESWFKRLDEEARRPGVERADEGSILHDALERYVKRERFDPKWQPHCEETFLALYKKFGADVPWVAEASFAHPMGFGGKCDLSAPAIIADHKSKPCIDKPATKYAYDNHVMQLAAYAVGLGLVPHYFDTEDEWDCVTLANAFVGCQDAKVALHVWTPRDAARGWRMFRHALGIWQEQKFNSAFSDEEAQAAAA
jgi:hypothetical protein